MRTLTELAALYADDPNDAQEISELETYVRRAVARRIRLSGKTCRRCLVDKPLWAFGEDSRELDGKHRHCHGCVNSAARGESFVTGAPTTSARSTGSYGGSGRA